MFGYIKPCKPELKIKEFDAYRAVYCGLCRQMGASFGPLARLALSYDFTFLCSLSYGINGSRPEVSLCRCCVNPLKKVPMCGAGGREDPVLAFGAQVALILIYYKLLDNIQDSGVFGKFGWSFLLPAVRRAWRKAAAGQPALEQVICSAMERQRQVESCANPGVDRACEPTATALGAVFESLSQDDGQRRVLQRMGYCLGRYVYLSDALDDLEKDAKTGNFNPFLGRVADSPEQAPHSILEEAKASLFLTAGEVGKAYNLLTLTQMRPVVDNVVHLGLVAGVEELLRKKEKRK